MENYIVLTLVLGSLALLYAGMFLLFRSFCRRIVLPLLQWFCGKPKKIDMETNQK